MKDRGAVRALVLCSAFLSAAVLVETCRAEPKSEKLVFRTGKFVDYLTSEDLRQAQPQTEIAIVAIPGLDRNETGNFQTIINAAKNALKHQSTMVIAPDFKTADDAPSDGEHFWSFGGWVCGDSSEDTEDSSKRLSSFEVADSLLEELADSTRFPNLKRIVLVGHSAGGQFINRYVAVGRALNRALSRHPSAEYRFIVANPSSYLYDDRRRPVSGTNAFEIPRPKPNKYNDWRYGLEERNAYSRQLSVDAIKKNVAERFTHYLVGSEDNKHDDFLDKTPAAMIQGKNRYDRWQNFKNYVDLFPDWKSNTRFTEVPGVGHSHRGIYASSAANSAIFH